MKKYMIHSTIFWALWTVLHIFVTCVFWEPTNGLVLVQLIPSICLIVYNLWQNIVFVKKYGWDA